MNQKEFKEKLRSNRICDLQELCADLNKRVLKLERKAEDEEKAVETALAD